jgi:hypothetical protein
MNLAAEILMAASEDRDEKIIAVAKKVNDLLKKELPEQGSADLALAALMTEFDHVIESCYGPEDRAYVLDHYVEQLRQRVISQRNKGMN